MPNVFRGGRRVAAQRVLAEEAAVWLLKAQRRCREA